MSRCSTCTASTTSTSRSRRCREPRAPARGAWLRATGRTAAVAVHPAGDVLLVEGVLVGQRDLGVDTHDRRASAHLEAMAGALARDQHLRDPEEAALQPALQAAHVRLADGEAADQELVAERRARQHDRAVAHEPGELRQEQPRVAPRAPQLRDRRRLRDRERLVAEEGLDLRPRRVFCASAAAPSGGGGSGARAGRYGQVHDRVHPQPVAVDRRQEHRLDVDEPLRQRDLAEEAVDLLVASLGADVDRDQAARARLERRLRLDLDVGEVGPVGDLLDERLVGGRRRAVGEDAPQRLEAAVEQQPLVGEGTGDRGRQQQEG